MTFGELKARVMLLVFSYSVAGTQIPATYNNQADYLAMIPGLVNEAQIEIATTVKRIPAKCAVSGLTHTTSGNNEIYALPSDCFLPMQGGLLISTGHRSERYMGYRVITGNSIELPAGIADRLTLEYWRYPASVSANTADSLELDNTPDVHECLPFYAAAFMVLYDDSYRYSVFYNEYEKRLSRLRETVWLEPGIIHDRYSGC